MAVHKNSEQAQRTTHQEKIVGLKVAPVIPHELSEDSGSDIGRLALQLLLELDRPNFGSKEVTEPDTLSECGVMRGKLLKLFQRQNIAEIDSAQPKISASGRRAFRAVLSSQPRGQQMLADPSAMPRGQEATGILLGIMREHFSLRTAVI